MGTDPVVPMGAYIKEMRAELARVDAKASMLLALAGAGLAVTAPLLAGDAPGHWPVRAGAAVAVAALLVLLSVVRPRIAPTAPFVALTSPGWEPQGQGERARDLARLTTVKFTRVRLAVDLLTAAVLLVGAGLIWIGASA